MPVPTSLKSAKWFMRLKARINAFQRGVAYNHHTHRLMPRLPDDGWSGDQFANHINSTEGFSGRNGCLAHHVETTAKEMGYVVRTDSNSGQSWITPPKRDLGRSV